MLLKKSIIWKCENCESENLSDKEDLVYESEKFGLECHSCCVKNEFDIEKIGTVSVNRSFEYVEGTEVEEEDFD